MTTSNNRTQKAITAPNESEILMKTQRGHMSRTLEPFPQPRSLTPAKGTAKKIRPQQKFASLFPKT